MIKNSSDKKIDFDDMAQEILCLGKLSISKYDVAYRTGKGIDDVRKAAEKARLPKNGHLKTEIQMRYLASALERIFKASPTVLVEAQGESPQPKSSQFKKGP